MALPRDLAPAIQNQQMLVLAQDPTVRVEGKILTADVDIPCEVLAPGPRGYRVYVVDYDASSGLLCEPAQIPVLNRPAEQLIRDPKFHAQNVYAIVMRTLARFEFSLGRRVSWSFNGHQIHVAPHAFRDANAFYSKRDRGLFFGYFEGEEGEDVFTCLSYDVIAHESTHAILDGLRERYTFPSSPDQAAFHEGYADVIALLSIFSLPKVVEQLMDLATGKISDRQFVNRSSLTVHQLKTTALLGLGEEVDPRRKALRRSVELEPDQKRLSTLEFEEPHRRGEVFVAAMMNAFLEIWRSRIAQLGDGTEERLFRAKVAEEGMLAADHLLTMAIRALDYAPSTDLSFRDYLTGLLTSDLEVQPDDSKYHYRDTLLKSFAAYGIPAAPTRGFDGHPGVWEPPRVTLDYSQTRFESMRQDRDEVFRFLWQNRKALELNENAYTRVNSVRPCVRLSREGFLVRETVAEYVQILNLTASELSRYRLQRPKGMPSGTALTLYGGGVLILGEYGQVKYHVRNKILNREMQNSRLDYLWRSGYFEANMQDQRRFAAMHRLKSLDGVSALGGTQRSYDGLF